MKIVSLFSGAGGLDRGFEAAGFEILWAGDLVDQLDHPDPARGIEPNFAPDGLSTAAIGLFVPFLAVADTEGVATWPFPNFATNSTRVRLVP